MAGICLRAGLYVTTNGTLSFLCLMVYCSALCLGICDFSSDKFTFLPTIREVVGKFFCSVLKCVCCVSKCLSVAVQCCRGLTFLCVLDDKMNLKGTDVCLSV